MSDLTTIPNPIIKGFSPDPSICRVGSEFYLVNSTFEYFPGVPIYRSADLRHWNLIGNCLTRESNLPLSGARASGGIFAPTLRYHDGEFYLVTTNMSHLGTYIVTAERAEGPWSDPLAVETSSYDPSLFWDDNGDCYFTSVEKSWIVQSRIDPKTGKLLEDPQQIWAGTGGQWPEGPHLFKRDGLYYLTIAEGGTEYGHMQTIARSDSPNGPFEPCPRNPILTHRSMMSPVQAVGHADFFDDDQGRSWAVCLGIRPVGYPPAYHLGRETFLVPVHWGEDGWPSVGHSGMLEIGIEETEPPDRERFRQGGPSPEWVYLRNPDHSHYRFGENGLHLLGSPIGLDQLASPTWIGRRQRQFTFRFEAEISPNLDAGGEAGVSVRMNEKHRYELGVNANQIFVRRTIGTLSSVTMAVDRPLGALKLTVIGDPVHYQMTASINGTVILRENAETRYLSTEVASGFTGVMLGLYAVSPSGKGYADFPNGALYEPITVEGSV